ncbi:MAG: hypothetical protein APR63_13990 [Desulfuromonas sp. SDB]|nr:MAG: hypothetical protein APR63_13990 [Desulfuromonas sp. SDB]
MLKRYQVMLHHWLEELIEDFNDKYSMSFSTSLRAIMYVGVISMLQNYVKNYKPDYTIENLISDLKNLEKGKTDIEKSIILSNLYFETQKAIESYKKEK